MRFGGKLTSTKKFRANYFAAESRVERLVSAGSEIISSLIMLVFGGVWTGFSGMIFFPAILNREEGNAALPMILCVGGFLCVGLGVLGFSLFRLCSIIRTIVAAPPVGCVPVTSQTEISAGTSDFAGIPENPFREAADGGEDTTHDDGLKETLGSKIFLTIFGLVFLFAGTTVSTIGVKKYLAEETAAGTWISAPCKIVSAKLARASGSKGGATYSPEIVYEFTVEGKTFRGDDIFISLNSSSNDYGKEARRLEKYRTQKTCWFNPENPKENALMKPVGGFSLRKILLITFGIPFVLVGGGILVGTFFGKKFKKKDLNLPPGALRTEADVSSPVLGAAVMCGFAAVWNLIVFTVGAGFFADGNPGAFPTLILGVLAVIGIGLIFFALRICLGISNPQYLLMLSPEKMPESGGNVRLSWRVLRGDPAKIQALKLEFVCLEKTNVYVNGKQREKVVESVLVYATMSRAEIASGTSEFFVPAELKPGKRVFRLSGKTAFFRPAVKIDFVV